MKFEKNAYLYILKIQDDIMKFPLYKRMV